MMTMHNLPNAAPAVRLAAISALALALSACSMGSMFAPASNDTSTLQNASPAQQDVVAGSTTALPAIATECPPIKVKLGGEALFYYGKGRVGNPRDLNYQAVIDKQSRNCVVSNGLITVKMGVVGRVLLGPAGSQASVDIPIRFSVERDDVAMFSQKYDIPVAINAQTQTADFVKVVENVAIPYTGGENIIIYVGFDG